MLLPYFVVDAFASRVFAGNQAGVCPLEQWLPEEVMQRIAAENNLAETAFFVREGGGYGLRWFTPAVEIDLCGHATLASAFVLFNELGLDGDTVRFESKSGPLAVQRRDDILELDFPARAGAPCAAPDALVRGFGRTPRETLRARDLLAVFETEEEILSLRPDMAQLATLDAFGIIATAPGGGGVDFVSRFFAPGAGVPEDPATGSSHCTLIPYWAKRLGTSVMHAKQLSSRGGEFFCRDLGERVAIGGKAVVYCRGSITI